jgi:hypothetical protein
MMPPTTKLQNAPYRVRGKGEAEVAKAAELRAKVYTAIAQLDHERERLINSETPR